MVHFLYKMSEKKLLNFRDRKIGNTIRTHRHNLGADYKTLEGFVYNRATELFDDEQWISVRHLSNIELGKNSLTIDKLITLADALEIDPRELFEEILLIYRQQEKGGE